MSFLKVKKENEIYYAQGKVRYEREVRKTIVKISFLKAWNNEFSF